MVNGIAQARRFAFFVRPGIGGTYSVYRELRRGLIRHNIALHWLSLGPDSQAVIESPKWLEERGFGTVLAPDTYDERLQARALRDHLEDAGYEAVFVNVLADRVQTNIVRYLAPRIRRIMIVHNITPGTYAAARAVRDYVHATVAVSPRIRSDLVNRLRFPDKNTHVVANAFDETTLESTARQPRDGPLRLLSLGRIEDASKGIFWLADILERLEDIPLTLTIAGDGPDNATLRQRLAPWADRVRFVGAVPPDAVATTMANHDIFLFPSRYEGHPVALVEALASGCVPIASEISGVTDFTIDHGTTGFLFPVGKPRVAAQMVRNLAADRALLARMSEAARAVVRQRFSPDKMIAGYMTIIDAVLSAPTAIAMPLQAEDWRLPAGLRPGWRTALPEPVKNRLRTIRERLVAR